MAKDRFVYVTYIRTTPQKLWKALTSPSFHKRYWFGMTLESSWKKGEPWKMVSADNHVWDQGKVLEIKPRKRLVISWQHMHYADMKKEGVSRATFNLAKEDGFVKLTVLHEINKAKSVLIEKVGGGWPQILASLKSMLETGKSLQEKK